jgi:hypothetical protein
MAEATLEKILLMLTEMPGTMAPAATATKPAMSAYSMRSWPWISVQTRAFKMRLLGFFMVVPVPTELV